MASPMLWTLAEPRVQPHDIGQPVPLRVPSCTPLTSPYPAPRLLKVSRSLLILPVTLLSTSSSWNCRYYLSHLLSFLSPSHISTSQKLAYQLCAAPAPALLPRKLLV